MECSHESGRQFAVMFFAVAAAFPVMLEVMDGQGGVRRLYNTVSTLRIIDHSSESPLSLLMTEDEEFAQRQALRHAMFAFKRYFEAHLIRKSEEIYRITGRISKSAPPQSAYKSSRPTPQQVAEHIETLMDIMPLRFVRAFQKVLFRPKLI